MNDPGLLIVQFEKNRDEVIRLHVTRYKGNRYLDIRVWKTADRPEPTPTARGVCIREDLVPELINALATAGKIFDRE